MAEAVQSSALPPETDLLEYRIRSVLQADGFGISYLARDTILTRDVVIKEYFPADLARRGPDAIVAPSRPDTEANFQKGLSQFLVEARTLSRFVHPNIVRVDRYFEANGTAYMLREYEKGESLAQKFSRGARPDEAALKAILGPLMDGLQAVHRAGVLHRDIKPGNVFIRDDGPPVLIDFGSARLASRDALQDLIPVLTPGYAPVEQYIRSDGQGPWSDIYSLAAVMFWAMTGEHPPDAISRLRMDAVGRMLNAVRTRYSAPFIEGVLWGLTLDENKRPQSVDQWADAVLRGRPATSAARPQRQAPVDDTRKYVWVSLGVLIFFLFVAGADIIKQRAGQSRMSKQSVGAGAVAAVTSAGLTREEFVRNLPGLADRFDQIDADRSGLVTTEELQDYLRRQGK